MDKKIVIRPSTINDFVNCSWKWYHTHVLGMISPTNSSAAVGTAIHKAAENFWKDAILQQQKPTELTPYIQAAENRFEDIVHGEEMNYENEDTRDTCLRKINVGARLYLTQIAPKLEIPTHLEHRVTYKIKDHPIVESVSGTIDFLDEKRNLMADIKTSKRAIVPGSYMFQQSLYTFLAQQCGFTIYQNAIHGVVFTKEPRAEMHYLETNIQQAKNLVNRLLETLRAFAAGVDPKILFRGNPKYYLCSYKYCPKFNNCFYNGGTQ